VTPEANTPTATQLTLLDSVIASVVRVNRLNRDDRQDFSQSVHLHLAERKYDVFARFAGRSSLRRFLYVVVTRLLLDWRNATMGKWRASAAARRLGPWAIELERLVYRDGHPPFEAIARLAACSAAPPPPSLSALLAELPVRSRRVEALLTDVPDSRVEDYVEVEDRRRRHRQASLTVARALRELPACDRRLIALRYAGEARIRDLASAHRVDAKVLYRQVERAIRSLRVRTIGAHVCTRAEAPNRPFASGSFRRSDAGSAWTT
jgi:DNA-directed RNA polymerase specialized sigma24 family protein